jgi:hypothetical protein
MTQYTYLGQSLLALERAAQQKHDGVVSDACAEDTPREDSPREAADRVGERRRDTDGHAKAPEVPGHKGLTPPRRTDSR